MLESLKYIFFRTSLPPSPLQTNNKRIAIQVNSLDIVDPCGGQGIVLNDFFIFCFLFQKLYPLFLQRLF
jgi:hypothetical protein